jgi:transposase
MLSIASLPTIELHAGATDMRKTFDGLSGIIRGSFDSDPADGSLFLFGNKRRDRLKTLG